MDPIRTCVGCRGRESKADLVRLAQRGSQVAVDEAQRLPGRGAYLHRGRGCAELAIRRRALSRAWPNVSVPPGPELEQLVAVVDAPLR